MPSEVDPELLVDAILMHVEDMNTTTAGSGTAWLLRSFKDTLAASLREDRVVSLSTDGDNTTFAVNMSAQALLAILTQARKRLPDADGNSTNLREGAMLIPRLSDFPLN